LQHFCFVLNRIDGSLEKQLSYLYAESGNKSITTLKNALEQICADKGFQQRMRIIYRVVGSPLPSRSASRKISTPQNITSTHKIEQSKVKYEK